MKETEIQAEILQYLKYRGIPVKRNQSGRIIGSSYWINLGEAGWPDIIGCLPGGRFLGIEVKRPGGKLSKTQKDIICQLNAMGALIMVVSSLTDVEEKLKDYNYG